MEGTFVKHSFARHLSNIITAQTTNATEAKQVIGSHFQLLVLDLPVLFLRGLIWLTWHREAHAVQRIACNTEIEQHYVTLLTGVELLLDLPFLACTVLAFLFVWRIPTIRNRLKTVR